jgi:hypothetical protein
MTEVAEVLQHASLTVTASPDSADFKLEVGMDGSSAGALQATVRMNGDHVAFSFGYAPGSEPTNPGPVRQVLDALENDDLFAVYYDSGHVVGTNGIWHRNTSSAPFPTGDSMTSPGLT